MHENDQTAMTPESARAFAERSTESIAERDMDYVLWKFGDDVDDIREGPNPVGERIGQVHGLAQAITDVKLIMRQDVTIRFMHVVPVQPSMWCGTKRVGRRSVRGSARETLDPAAGLDEFQRS